MLIIRRATQIIIIVSVSSISISKDAVSTIFRVRAPLFLNSVLNSIESTNLRDKIRMQKKGEKKKKELRFVYKDKGARGGGYYSHRVENVSAA